MVVIAFEYIVCRLMGEYLSDTLNVWLTKHIDLGWRVWK